MDYFIQAAIIFQVNNCNIENYYNMNASRELDETIILLATNSREQETYDMMKYLLEVAYLYDTLRVGKNT
jgi:hypothetical protein